MGQGIGGSSLLNALFYTRPNPKDFEIWGAKNPGWTFEEVLPYIMKSEDFTNTNSKYAVDGTWHREGGRLPVNYPKFISPKTDYFIQAFHQTTSGNYSDMNGRDHVGIMTPQLNTRYGKRYDAGTSFVLPVMDRTNLVVSPKSFVTKVLIDNGTRIAHSVLFTNSGKLYRAKATKEIILSAGAINSAKLLMLSGVGPKDHLEKLGKYNH